MPTLPIIGFWALGAGVGGSCTACLSPKCHPKPLSVILRIYQAIIAFKRVRIADVARFDLTYYEVRDALVPRFHFAESAFHTPSTQGPVPST